MISVIVPIYNAKKHLDKCLQSILSQTFTDIELLLMDDGSTDASGRLCDEYAKADKRVKVVHLDNGGAAYARNRGLDIFTGEIVMFVDADDYIPKNHIQILYELMLKTNSDMVSAGVTYVPGPVVEHPMRIYNTQQLLEAVCYRDGIGDYPISKLYKRYMFEELRFVEGITSEDFEVFYRLYTRAKKAAVTDETTYYYEQNSGSVSNGTFNRKFFNRMEICQELIEQIGKEYPDILPSAYSRAVDENIWLYGITPREYSQQRAQMQETVKKYAEGVRRDTKATKKVKRKLLLFLVHPSLWTLRMECKNLLIKIYSIKRVNTRRNRGK